MEGCMTGMIRGGRGMMCSSMKGMMCSSMKGMVRGNGPSDHCWTKHDGHDAGGIHGRQGGSQFYAGAARHRGSAEGSRTHRATCASMSGRSRCSSVPCMQIIHKAGRPWNKEGEGAGAQ
eukprot:305608-Chlamydomonas_euryale.AAC.3